MSVSIVNLTYLQRFEMWYEKPFLALEVGAKDWNGAYIALSMGMFLCERYYRTKTGTHDLPDKKDKESLQGYDQAFRYLAATDLGIRHDHFNHFWNVFRNGIQHQGMPRTIEDRDKTGKILRIYKGRISTKEGYSEIPTMEEDGKVTYIKLNPWAFTKKMIKKFKDHPTILELGFHHAFAEVYESQTSLL